MNALDELFMAETMIGLVEMFAEQSAERSYIGIYDEYAEEIRPTGNDFKYDEVTYSRDLAPVTGTTSPSKATQRVGLTKRTGDIYAIKEHVDLPVELVMMAKGAGSEFPDPEGWLNRNLRNLVNRIQRTRNYWAAKSFLTQTGAIDLSAFPNADIGSAPLVYPVQDIDATAGWDNPANDIRGMLATARKTYKRSQGYKPGVVLASDTVEAYLTKNTLLAGVTDGGSLPDLALRKVQNDYLEGGTFTRVAGMEFVYAQDDYYADATPTTAVPVITDSDLIALLPPRQMWYDAFGIALGRVWVPSGSIGHVLNGNPFDLLVEQRGWSVYVELTTNPIGLRLHVVWHGCLFHKHQGAVAVYDTTP